MSSSLVPKETLIKLNQVNANMNTKYLFLLAGIEGNCDIFVDLAESLAKSNIQVYGLQYTLVVPVDTIQAVASYYLNEIEYELSRCRNNSNEFYIGAYSFSGPIAIEIVRILEQEDTRRGIKVKQLFLFDSSHCFFKIGAHLNFQIFGYEIINDNIFNHKNVYTAVLSIYITNLFGLNKHKFDLHKSLESSKDLDDAIDRSFDYFSSRSLLTFDNEASLNENKVFLKLLLLKSSPCHLYEYKSNKKLSTPFCLFKPKLFIYSKSLESYNKMKNSIEFKSKNYNLHEIAVNYKVDEYALGNHWSFINDNLSEITSKIEIEMLIRPKL